MYSLRICTTTFVRARNRTTELIPLGTGPVASLRRTPLCPRQPVPHSHWGNVFAELGLEDADLRTFVGIVKEALGGEDGDTVGVDPRRRRRSGVKTEFPLWKIINLWI